MPLHARRQRLAEMAEREANGESLWTEWFDSKVRTKIEFAFLAASANHERDLANARQLILRDEGIRYLANQYSTPAEDMLDFLRGGSNTLMPTAVEALKLALKAAVPNVTTPAIHAVPEVFEIQVNRVLQEHRVSWELINGEMVPSSSRELHTEVIAPTLRLLGSAPPEWDKVERAYQDALGEIANNKPGDAITDAATALQEALTLLGCKGNALGPLIKSAVSKGLLAAHDERLTGAVESVMTWVSADRSTSGDAHAVTDASVDDAWFMVHVVGALLLRLSKGPRT